MRPVLQVALGILTAIGGFLDVGALATSGQAGARFGLGLVWALLLGTVCIVLLLLQAGRLAAVAGNPYAAAVREHLGFKFSCCRSARSWLPTRSCWPPSWAASRSRSRW